MKSFDWLIPLLLFVFYVVASCSGLFLLKAAPTWTSLSFVAGFLLYCVGAVTWIVILRHYPLSVAFPVAAGALMIGSMLIGSIFLKEGITAQRLAGAGLIFAGIVLMAQKAPN